MILRTFSTSLSRKAPHTSLASFIDYASLNQLDLKSTVYRGTLYEYTVLETLTSLSCFELYRTGGADDKGIDLRGHLILPDTARVPVVVQCKHESKKIGPKYIRELNGSSSDETLSIMASASHYTPKAIQALMVSKRPICLSLIQPFERGSVMQQLIWNVEAAKILGSLEVKVMHGLGDDRIKLYHGGKPLVNRAQGKKKS